MQTFAFRTSAPDSARLDTSSIDYAVLPSPATLFAQPPDDPFARLRMPLLPDNLSGCHGPETPDAPLSAPALAADCTRETLKAAADSLIAAQTAGDPNMLKPVFDSVASSSRARSGRIVPGSRGRR